MSARPPSSIGSDNSCPIVNPVSYTHLDVYKRQLFHGYTYSAHPLAMAAAIATLQLYEREQLFARARSLAAQFENAAHALRGAAHVRDIRNLGLMAGIELEPLPSQPGARGYEVFLRCLERGVLVRYTCLLYTSRCV